MREPPVDLPSDALCACLCTNYGLAVADLTFLPPGHDSSLPPGHDSSAWVYRVRTADDTPLFLVGPREEELFLQGYGATTVDPLALTYYRYAWAVSDIGAFGAQVFLRPDLGAVTRRAAVDAFMGLFLPGNMVALAFASDHRVP